MAPVNLVGRRKRTITAELTFDETEDSPVLFLSGHADFGHGQVCRVDIRWDGQSSLTVPPSEDRVRFEYYLRNDDGDYVEKSGAREEYEHDSQVEGFVSKGEHAQIVVLPDWMEALVGERISVNDLGTGSLSVRFIPAYEAGYRRGTTRISTQPRRLAGSWRRRPRTTSSSARVVLPDGSRRSWAASLARAGWTSTAPTSAGYRPADRAIRHSLSRTQSCKRDPFRYASGALALLCSAGHGMSDAQLK